MMFADDFREILDIYPQIKTEDFKKNKSDIESRLSDNLIKDLNSSFVVKAFCGQASWADNPWVNIVDGSFDNFQEALTIEYKFDTSNSSVELSIIPRLKVYSEYISLRKYLINILNNHDLRDFEIIEDSYSILSKRYSYDNLDDETLSEDLNFLLDIYNELNSFFKNRVEEFENPQPLFYSKGHSESFEDICENKSLGRLSNMEIAEDALYELTEKKEIILDAYYESAQKAPDVRDITITYPKENIYRNYLSNPKDFFTDENIDKIVKCNLSADDYRNILIRIKQDAQMNLINTIKENHIDFNDLETKDKVLLFSKSFTKTTFKSIGRRLGYYSFGEIKIDDRLPNPLIITSIIHELSHFILEKILKESLMKILDTNDTPLISSYVKILLEDNDLNYLMDEFCAHTVEGRFALYGFQDYSSFNYKLNEISHMYSEDDIDYALIVANTFAYDIKDMLEEFITDNIRQDIKDEFSNSSARPNYEPLDLEIESRLENENFIQAIALILTTGVGEALNNPDKLERYMNHLS
ncbi:hypothetical protein [Methanobrevibacter sp.]|uniref:hypothetical protein n=1 Tax=Methanobrevibacter sp. TaxID=66852 RepID=UPI00388DA6AD